jgi:hypothetical protein
MVRVVGLVFLVGAVTAAVACEGGYDTGPDGSALVGQDGGAGEDGATGADAAPPGDADTPDPDGGSANITATCTALCAKGEECFDVDETYDCVSGCIAELGAMCSADEIAKLAACAALDCDSFESCVYTVPCMGMEEYCGNGVCADTEEDCWSCPEDCGDCFCGDGTCSPGECATCTADCPDGCYCGDVCKIGPAHDPSCGDCQAEICAVDSYCCEFEWDGTCVGEAETVCGKDCPAFCGDFVCDPTEDPETCPQDCDEEAPDVPPEPEP